MLFRSLTAQKAAIYIFLCSLCMSVRMETTRLLEKHSSQGLQNLIDNAAVQNYFLLAAALFVLILIAGVLMISSSINSNVAQRTKFFGMMRCIGMSRQQIIRFVRLEALNWCRTAIPIGVVLGIVITCYCLCVNGLMYMTIASAALSFRLYTIQNFWPLLLLNFVL